MIQYGKALVSNKPFVSSFVNNAISNLFFITLLYSFGIKYRSNESVNQGLTIDKRTHSFPHFLIDWSFPL